MEKKSKALLEVRFGGRWTRWELIDRSGKVIKSTSYQYKPEAMAALKRRAFELGLES